MVDTTCGSVLNVWKNVERYAREGFTSLVHGKGNHEETRATVSPRGPRTPAAATWSSSTWPRPSSWRTTSAGTAGDRAAFLARFGRGRPRRASTPTATSRASASRTRPRCSRASRSRSRAGSGRPSSDRYGPAEGRDALPLLRHDLLGHPGPPGRARGPDPRAARPAARDRRLQLVQHGPPGRDGRGPGAGVPHRRRGGPCSRRGRIRHKPVAARPRSSPRGWLPRGPDHRGVTAGAPHARRHDRRRRHPRARAARRSP